MSGGIIFLSTLSIFIGFVISQKNTDKFFRSDYSIIGSSFYKYHNKLLYREEATEVCENEGATLFYPETEEEISSREWITWSGTKVGTTTPYNFHIGVYVLNADTKETMTVDNKTFNLPFELHDAQENGEPLCLFLYYPDMILRSYACDRFKASFFCKKTQASVQWNDKCNMAVISSNGNDYEYDSKLDKCYKLHAVPRTWEKAVEVCEAEQSKLTELNSQEEANHLIEIVTRVPEEEFGVVCLGFRKFDDGWKMLSGKLLQVSGYPMWAHTQPDGGEFEGLGAMAYNGRLHDIGDSARCVFVCERDVVGTH